MNAVVLYYDTITKYRGLKCNAGSIAACLHRQFDGEEYFNEFILKHDGPPLFGDKTRRIKLDSCGDSTPRYAIYQLQSTRLTYHVTYNFNAHYSHFNFRKSEHGRMRMEPVV